jgi:RHH-type transcriptional regulator, proline utilization regulon repressor / proline dehydrogenase / delta 1-pyrroline-5-carboxylate dehydrogenase
MTAMTGRTETNDGSVSTAVDSAPRPFADFAPPLGGPAALRQAIAALTRRAEPECLPPLLAAAELPPDLDRAAEDTARALVTALRAQPLGRGVDGLVQEYKLSTPEGVALMCLAEALLRIPDAATRDALIRDKISGGDWWSHLGGGASLFVNAATWGLLVTGTMTRAFGEPELAGALARLIARGGEPLIRKGVELSMGMMGSQFVKGRDIGEALVASRAAEAKGFRYSYDMLGEAAVTEEDARRYVNAYETAIRAIGNAALDRGVHEGPGVSVKLSALHPRYARAQADRVMSELLPRLKALAVLAKRYDIGFNIDAEESERLEISLDLLEALCLDPGLAGWDGLGFVVQAYGKRCPAVIDLLIDLARRSGHRLMVRLVKGAYWDSEIKRTQAEGQADFPVYTRKVHTDVAYLACARKLLDAPDAIFPQFATHNARTLAAVYHMAGPAFDPARYEFQCLHGMGEPLYREVTALLKRPCRIYAPVGTHETLLAYLVRRLLENGANSSFVNQIADKAVPVDALIADPVAAAKAIEPLGSPHPRIAAPSALFGAERRNSAGYDLTTDAEVQRLAAVLRDGGAIAWRAAPLLASGERGGPARPVLNPADRRDLVGTVVETSAADIAAAVASAAEAAPVWAATPPATRAAILARAADALEARMPVLIGLIVREAGKTAANAVAEVREAVDFLRYYGARVRDTFGPGHEPLGPVACISPWNFPLAIFTGQVAAALAAGNTVLAKPAEETPLIAAEAVRILRAAGVPAGALQLLPGDGATGAALVARPEVRGVLFTGSTGAARAIQATLAGRTLPDGTPIPLIAETGGQNAMMVDSTALPEQVIADVLTSAFDSAGQRCSALRVLCLQDDIADRTLAMLTAAMAELRAGNPGRLATDVGPVIGEEARAAVARHIAHLRGLGHPVFETPLPPETAHGTFIAPTLIEIDRIGELPGEVFGPVLHVLRYRRDELEAVIDAINATGYALTFGLHTRIDTTVARITARAGAGNVYVNRNIVGAVVGVQPFGGHGLSGTGPKAGGPLYLLRLLSRRPASDAALSALADATPGGVRAAGCDYARWLDGTGRIALAERARALTASSPLEASLTLPGPVGEENIYRLVPRGRILLLPETVTGLLAQLAAVFATGNDATVDAPAALRARLEDLPPALAARVTFDAPWDGPLDGALIEGDARRVAALQTRLTERPGPVVTAQALDRAALESGEDYRLEGLLGERSVSVNTTAAGGNASMTALV